MTFEPQRMGALARLDAMIADTRSERARLRREKQSTLAADCAIREKALLDARDVVSKAMPEFGELVQAMLRARDSLGNCTGKEAAEACAEAALKLMERT